jgi:hypothetical protein
MRNKSANHDDYDDDDGNDDDNRNDDDVYLNRCQKFCSPYTICVNKISPNQKG